MTRVSVLFLFPLITLAAATPIALSNVGFFNGSGFTIQLAKTEQVQLVSEEVIIQPRRKADFPLTSRVKYRCTFTLKNLSEERVSIQVGFPLNTEQLNSPLGSMYSKTNDVSPELKIKLIQDVFNFTVRDTEKAYSVKYEKKDAQQKFRHVFLWEVDFSPHASRTLEVRYEMPASFGIYSLGDKTDMSSRGEWGWEMHDINGKEHPKWYHLLEHCYVECFFYVTETASSWAGDIEQARFVIDCDLFEKNSLDLLDPKNKKKAQGMFTGLLGEKFRHLTPAGWRKTEDGVELSCKNCLPKANIQYRFYYSSFPQKEELLESWIYELFKENPTRKKLEEMREILLAFYRIEATSEEIRSFVNTQIWYDPEPGFTEESLPARRKAILKKLDEIIEKSGE